MLKTLSYIGKKLNDGGITWGVGASILLNKFGFIDKPNDMMILRKQMKSLKVLERRKNGKKLQLTQLNIFMNM